MDHLDWFTPGSEDVDQEIEEFHRVLTAGGFVLWRSAAKKPWYNEVYAYLALLFGNVRTDDCIRFERKGFNVVALAIREGPKVPIDRVNMCVSHSCYPPAFD